MPGPSNKRKQKKTRARKEKRRSSVRISIGHSVESGEAIGFEEVLERGEESSLVNMQSDVHNRPLPEPPIPTYHSDNPPSGTSLSFITSSPSPSLSPSPPPSHSITFDSWDLSHNHTPAPPYISSTHPNALSQKIPNATSLNPPDDDIFLRLSNPIIHDPGNGPRVLSAREFIQTSFAQPSCASDPLRSEFAQPEVLQMLCTVLPEETAIFVWYNKSRKVGRVCPACRRLYQLGDALSNTFTDLDMDDPPEKKEPSPYLAAEQEISGLCSPLCFILASYNYPHIIRSTWGRMAEDLDDETWALLNTPARAQPGQEDVGLSMVLKMTRLHDLGLAQLCVPEMGIDEEIYEHDDHSGLNLNERSRGVVA